MGDWTKSIVYVFLKNSVVKKLKTLLKQNLPQWQLTAKNTFN